MLGGHTLCIPLFLLFYSGGEGGSNISLLAGHSISLTEFAAMWLFFGVPTN